MMRNTTCPYLGLKEDAKTTLNFASPGNYCHRASPISPVQGEHQNQVCLTGEHINCPIYRAAQPVPMPVNLAAPAPDARNWRKTLTLAGIPVLIAFAAVLSTPWNNVSAWLAARQMVPNTGGGGPLRWSVVNNTQNPANKFESIAEANPAADTKPGLANCPMPSGWTLYEVTPTDSLYRLSVIYGVDIAAIQKANCFGDETAILPGQNIYLPLNQLKTPTSIPTVTPFPIRQFITQPPAEDNSEDEASPTDAPPSNVPPTQVAPTDPPKDPPKDNTKDKKPKDEKPKDKGGKGKGKGKGG